MTPQQMQRFTPSGFGHPVLLLVTQSQQSVVRLPLLHPQQLFPLHVAQYPRHVDPLLMQLYGVVEEQQFLLQQDVLQHGEGPQQLGQQAPAAWAGDARNPINPAVPDETATNPAKRLVEARRRKRLRSMRSARKTEPGSVAVPLSD